MSKAADNLAGPRECFAALHACSPRTLDELRAHLRSCLHADCERTLDGDGAVEPCDRCNALHALEQFVCHAECAIEG